MFAAERQRLITEIVRRDGAVTIHDLAVQVEASDVTVRRDLRFLEDAGQLRRQHGGAMPLPDQGAEPTYADKQAHRESGEGRRSRGPRPRSWTTGTPS